MTREIKFRAWDRKSKKFFFLELNRGYPTVEKTLPKNLNDLSDWKQYTGLKDKNGNGQEVYDGDILDVNGKVKGNIYEIKEADKDQFDLVIQGFGTKAWLTTYQNAVDRGCKDAE